MITRREFMGKGLSAVALGLTVKTGWAQILSNTRGIQPTVHPSDPVAQIPTNPQSINMGGFPFESWFTGDDFPEAGEGHIEIPPFMQPIKKGDLPEPTEAVRVAVIGGGISGLTSAYLLREFDPVLFDLHERFGGTARGESWAGTNYSLGNAYIITPDKGTFLDNIYQELGLPEAYAFSGEDDPVEIDDQILYDFWVKGYGGNPDEIAALADYAKVVAYMADKGYPDIPYDKADEKWIFELDSKTLKQDIEERMSLPVPPLLESAIQGYCFSSFVAGWDQISAAGGWNFLAAEEYGRWVFPGGTSYVARALWQKLHTFDQQRAAGTGPRLRSGAFIVDVRMSGAYVRITYRDARGQLHGMLAERAIMACPKMICKHIIHDVEALDPEKAAAMALLHYGAYMVVNVLLNRPLEQDFYDVFLLGDSNQPLGSYDPCGTPFESDDSPVTDVLDGVYAQRDLPRSVLTLYWPLMCASARFELVFNHPWRRWAKRLTPQLNDILSLLNLQKKDVAQVRMSRWGHAVPIHLPNLISGGTIELIRRPIEDKIFFVNQDNWALPAVENSMLDAEIMTTQIREALVG